LIGGLAALPEARPLAIGLFTLINILVIIMTVSVVVDNDLPDLEYMTAFDAD